MPKIRKLTKKQSKRLWLFTIWIVVIFFFTFMMLNIYGPRISRESLLNVPQIKSVLDKDPNVRINETFIGKDDSMLAILAILEKCGKEVEEMDLVLVEIESNGSIIKAYFDPVTQEAICVFTEDAAGGAGAAGGDDAGGGAGGDGPSGAPCIVVEDCDDGNPYTIDACVDGFCENALKTCSQIGGTICAGARACDGTSITASDGSCCLGSCSQDECQTDADCDDGNPYTTDACVDGFCENALKTCGEQGHVTCASGQECSAGGFVPASDTSLCCDGECQVSQGTRCDSDADCQSNNPTIQGSCVSGYCKWTHLDICASGDDICLPGCTVQNDADCV